jgi:HPt (histidine-containing phosphotransfer) domain-containing protein
MISGGVMTDQHHVVAVERDLEDLIPTYLANRAKEAATLRAALADGDLEKLRQLGHRMKGVGAPYGFDKVSAFGKQIEDGAKAADHFALKKCINDYIGYIAQVQVVYK